MEKRFPALGYDLRLKIDTCLQVIVATAVLHNIAIGLRDIVIDDGMEGEEEDAAPIAPTPNDVRNDAVRRALIATHFAS